MMMSRTRTIPAAAYSSVPLMPLKTLIASRLKPAAPVSLTSRPSAGSPMRSRIDWTASWKASPDPSPGCTGCTMIADAPSGEKTGGLRLEHERLAVGVELCDRVV